MRIGNLNLWVSVPSLLCGFAVWLYWGIITVQMLNLGFPFSKPELFTLTAIAGFTGATLRIPSTAVSEQIGLSRGVGFRSLRRCAIPSVISTVRPR
jgi:nitrate/nitrite transporter NarK